MTGRHQSTDRQQLTNRQQWLTRWKMRVALVLGGAVAALGGALVGWRPAASGAAESAAIARQIAQFRNLRDGIQSDLDELKEELAKRTAAPPPQPAASLPPEQKPAPLPPNESSPAASPANAPPPIEKPAAENRAAATTELKAAEEALDQSDVAQAIKMLEQAAEKATEPDRPQIDELLKQARQALPKAVLAKLQQSIADADNDRIERWIASGELPPEWAKDFSDSHVADAFRKAAVKLLPIAWHNRELTHFNRRAARTLDGSYLDYMNHLPRMYVFRDLALLHRQGRFDAASVKQVSDLYTAYGVEGFLPALRGLLVAGMEPDPDNALRARLLADCEEAAVRGEFDLTSCAAMFDECRQLAPEHYRPIDAPHPLAGRWRGKLQWQIHVDIPNGKVTYVRPERKAELVVAILKVGVDYLVGYAPKLYDGAGNFRASMPGEQDPFWIEKLAPSDTVPRKVEGDKIAVAGLTLFIADENTKTMDAYRRLEPGEAFIKKFFADNPDTWRELSDVKHFRLFERYRQATAPASR